MRSHIKLAYAVEIHLIYNIKFIMPLIFFISIIHLPAFRLSIMVLIFFFTPKKALKTLYYIFFKKTLRPLMLSHLSWEWIIKNPTSLPGWCGVVCKCWLIVIITNNFFHQEFVIRENSDFIRLLYTSFLQVKLEWLSWFMFNCKLFKHLPVLDSSCSFLKTFVTGLGLEEPCGHRHT